MNSPNPSAATETARLLRRAAAGEDGAGDALLPILYGELHRLAQGLMGGDSPTHTLQPTALVHEAWLRLRPRGEDFESRRHFLQFAAKAMRSVLVDHARASRAQKRGGQGHKVTLDQELLARDAGPEELLTVDEALLALAGVDGQLAQIVELRVFGGLENQEVADSIGVSLRTVERGWRLARAWLIQHMGSADGQRPVE